MAKGTGNVKVPVYKFIKKREYFSYNYTNQKVNFSNLSNIMHDIEKLFQDH